MIDSVFSELLAPFPDDRPLIPVQEIEQGMDAIESAVQNRMTELEREQTRSFMAKAEPLLQAGDAAGVMGLEWNLGVILQGPIVAGWSFGWRLGGGHMLREMRAAVPSKFSAPNWTRVQFAGLAESAKQLLELKPIELPNSPAEKAVQDRAIALAGNFSNDQLNNLKADLIAAMNSNAISRPELLQRVQANLNVGKARAQAIARTELTNAYNMGRVATARQSDLITGYRFLAIADKRTTQICLSRNGMIIPAKDEALLAANLPALHVGCRSTISPIMGTLNPEHKDWENDPKRDPNARSLVPLQKGWKTGTLPAKPKPPEPKKAKAPKAPKTPKVPKAAPSKFPTEAQANKLEVVRALGGSTGAELVRDPSTGQLFVRKYGDSAGHLLNEAAADGLYRAIGIDVPECQVYGANSGRPFKLAEFIDGQPLSALSGKKFDAARTAIQKGLAADALLGNWDVVGLNLDNILIDKSGKPWRIDNGGSLEYRAQGAAKGAAWNKYPSELWTLRNPNNNPQTAQVFGDLDYYAIADQMRDLVAKRDTILNAAPDSSKDTLRGRLAEMERLVKIADTFKADRWNSSYTSEFSKHLIGLRSSGLVDQMPTELKQSAKGGVRVKDENGKPFDNLRGKGSHLEALRDYIVKQGGSYDVISDWMKSQATDSWLMRSQALKWFVVNSRAVPLSTYYWQRGEAIAEALFQATTDIYSKRTGNPLAFGNTMTMWHAFNYELLDRVDLEPKTPDGKIRLLRTEDKSVMTANNLKVGDSGVRLKRGAIESTSIFKEVKVYGSELTVQEVPIHRIFGTYFTEQEPGQGGTGFMSDKENEFVALLDDIPFDYIKGEKVKVVKPQP